MTVGRTCWAQCAFDSFFGVGEMLKERVYENVQGLTVEWEERPGCISWDDVHDEVLGELGLDVQAPGFCKSGSFLNDVGLLALEALEKGVASPHAVLEILLWIDGFPSDVL